MDYLYKIYYKDKDNFLDELDRRFHFPITYRTGLEIETDEGTVEELFYLPNMYTNNLMTKTLENDGKLTRMTEGLPKNIMDLLYLDSLANELQASHEVQGIYTTRDEFARLAKNLHDGKDIDDKKYSQIIKKYIALCKEATPFPTSSEDIVGVYKAFTFMEEQEPEETSI